jgi:ABC-type lipoprotein export system ATPase subunit
MNDFLNKPIAKLESEAPELQDLFNTYGIRSGQDNISLGRYLENLSQDYYEDIGIDKATLIGNMRNILEQRKTSGERKKFEIGSLTIIGGHDKRGTAEDVRIDLIPGTITSIVGPTGSGKSRLLADIEWMAQKDTPTGRTILVDGEIPDKRLRFSLEHKLVAQLSQNMNFVMDTSVAEFIRMHSVSRMIKDRADVVEDIVIQANLLAGESFSPDTPITSLSGGQSRALMIADTAFLSLSPVVLIDEIENAGIDRKKALGLLVRKEKIVIMATHDPILALMAQQRLVIKNGGILKVIRTTGKEKTNLAALEVLDNRISTLRNLLRSGEILDGDI